MSTSNINYLQEKKGLLSWLFTVDHKRIGLMYLGGVTLAFLLGGIFALLIRLELFSPGSQFVQPDRYNSLFTLHGVIMVFLFIIPAIPGALGNFILPIQLGASDVAFPKLNLTSFYLWFIGLCIALATLIMGNLDGGWTFYAPYTISGNKAVVWAVFAAFILGFSSILTGLNFVVTVHKLRAPGQSWFKLPLFIWALYATALVQVIATPVVGITLVLLIMENILKIGIFDPALGGDPVLFQHFFWFYSHPAVYIMILPAFGVISEIIPTFSRRNIFGYKIIAFSSVAIAVIGFLVWGHHMFVSGQSTVASTAFAFLTFLVGVPTAIKVFNWLATLYKGSIELKTPMLYALIFLFLFTIGGLTGITLGILSVDVHLHDTYFVVAHFHYVMMGGTVMGFLAGVHYWWPKMTGRMYSETWGKIGAFTVFAGFNLTFMPQFIMGTLGMPRRYNDYVPEYEIFHKLSSIGAGILGIGLFIALFYLIASLFNGKKAEQNPWGSKTLEWEEAASPPVTHNFTTQPVITHGPYEYGVEVKA